MKRKGERKMAKEKLLEAIRVFGEMRLRHRADEAKKELELL